VAALLGYYAPPDMSFVARLEWGDGKPTLVDTSGQEEKVLFDRAAEPGNFIVAPGSRDESGEPVQIRRRPDGKVVSLQVGAIALVRLDPAG
jgi:hypothetical protein